MIIKDTRVRIIENSDSKLKAIASIVIEGCFAIHDIKIIEGNEGVFIAMPSRKTAEGTFTDIAQPINSETREMVKNIILDAYKKAVEEI
ncbi:MAG: septation regulator SpoVG [Clostridia bacterium]|nr:septation regulator SpoVG [Clostridia bacterium]